MGIACDIHRWDFTSPTAELRSGPLTARVNISQPQLGVHNLRWNGAAIGGRLLATAWSDPRQPARQDSAAKHDSPAAWPITATDAYVRGGDLVATYGRLPNSHYAPQLYWSIEQPPIAKDSARSPLPAHCLLALTVSIQTDLLDSHPEIQVSTQLPAEEMIRVAEGCVVWRLTGSPISYAEFALARDFHHLSLNCNSEGMHIASWDLFAEFLEKGVIRRAQIKSAILPREDDTHLAKDYCEALERRPLPLTT
jgi:hypothetical protein